MWISTNKSGNTEYRKRYKDPLTDKYKTVTVTLEGPNTRVKERTAAEELDRLIKERISASSTENITLMEVKERYITYQEKVNKKSTCIRNERTLRICCRQIGADILVKKLTAGYIRDRLLLKTQTPTTYNEYVRRLKAMLRWAYDSDYLPDASICEKLKYLKDDEAESISMKPEDKYLEPEQLAAVLGYMEKSSDEWYLFTKFLVLSGLRIGEAMALNKSDILDDEISVSKTYSINAKETTAPKTPASNRKVFIQPELAEVITEIKRYYRNRDILTGTRTELFFSDDDGKHIHYGAYVKYIREATISVLGERRTPHSLRHTHASLLFAEGVSIDTISRRLGHENSKVTREIYLHIVEKIKERDKAILSTKRLLA